MTTIRIIVLARLGSPSFLSLPPNRFLKDNPERKTFRVFRSYSLSLSRSLSCLPLGVARLQPGQLAAEGGVSVWHFGHLMVSDGTIPFEFKSTQNAIHA